MQDSFIEMFGACGDNTCQSGADRVVPYDAVASTAWDTIAANLSTVYGETISAERAEQMGSTLMTWAAEKLLNVKEQKDQQNNP